MTPDILETVIKSVLAGMSRAYGVSDIEKHHTLKDLGLTDDPEIAEFKNRMYRTISGGLYHLEFKDFYEALTLTNLSTVAHVLKTLMLSLPGNDPTKPK